AAGVGQTTVPRLQRRRRRLGPGQPIHLALLASSCLQFRYQPSARARMQGEWPTFRGLAETSVSGVCGFCTVRLCGSRRWPRRADVPALDGGAPGLVAVLDEGVLAVMEQFQVDQLLFDGLDVLALEGAAHLLQ